MQLTALEGAALRRRFGPAEDQQRPRGRAALPNATPIQPDRSVIMTQMSFHGGVTANQSLAIVVQGDLSEAVASLPVDGSSKGSTTPVLSLHRDHQPADKITMSSIRLFLAAADT
ncbi:MAG: hypothetical protein AB7E72_05640 [Lysobacterales bacterium]